LLRLCFVCVGFHCPVYDSVRCDNGAPFGVVIFVVFLGFLPGPSKLVGVIQVSDVTETKICSGSCYIVFANVAKDGNMVSLVMFSLLRNVQSNRLLLLCYCYGHDYAL
jgi:hypothetical protein